MIHDRVLITLSCGHTTMGERICSTCVEYYESVPCDACADRVVPDPPTGCECSPLREPECFDSPACGARGCADCERSYGPQRG